MLLFSLNKFGLFNHPLDLPSFVTFCAWLQSCSFINIKRCKVIKDFFDLLITQKSFRDGTGMSCKARELLQFTKTRLDQQSHKRRGTLVNFCGYGGNKGTAFRGIGYLDAS